MVPKDVTRLWEELRHRDPEEKLDWIRQVAKDPTPESVEMLLDVLEQESWFLRDQAGRALATMGEMVVEPLIEYLGSGLWYTRAVAATTLGRIGLPMAAEPLTDLLRDPNRTVRDAAWDALAVLARNDFAAHAVADAFASLPLRAQRFALDGLAARDGAMADRIAAMVLDPGLRAARERTTLARVSGDDDGLSWDDVVGRLPEAGEGR
ncbi:MAG TPA: HEAT repeat domain-containing protein [Candidatus Eisenbacteria bacterium]